MTDAAESAAPGIMLREIAEQLDGASDELKRDISHIKLRLADPHAQLPASAAIPKPNEAKTLFARFQGHARKLRNLPPETLSDAERTELARLQTLIPEIRPLIQRLIALATELDNRTARNIVSPRKKWRHY